ncbi:MAG TPA: hypothetical protein VJ982_00090 [Gemmatimonadota bacterium]|nr:hypothetical protein [Gemmatimonadota bacterium]
MEYSRAERISLWLLAAVGLIGINGAFLWTLYARPGALDAALRNPLAIAFMIEAMLLVVALAWLFRKVGLTRLGWGWFVVLALVGSLAFAVPVALLTPRRSAR